MNPASVYGLAIFSTALKDILNSTGTPGKHSANVKRNLLQDLKQGETNQQILLSLRLREELNILPTSLMQSVPARMKLFIARLKKDSIHRLCRFLQISPIKLGRELTFDGAKEKFVKDKEADAMLTRDYRKPYVVPNVV